MRFVPLEEADKAPQSLTFVPLEAEAAKPAPAPAAEAKTTPPPATTTAPKPDANIDPTTGKPYPELRALPEPSVWDKLWAFATRNETIDNKAKAANEYAARKYAAENNVPLSTAYKVTKDAHRPVFNPEGRESPQAAVQSAAAVVKSLPDMPEAALNTTLRAIRGGDVPVKDRTWLDRSITATTQAPRKGDPNVTAFANVGQSLGYSMTTMVSAAVSDAIAGPYAAGAVGVTVPYRASKDEFLSRLRENLNEKSETIYKKPLSEKDWGKAREEFEDAATRYGAWEAVPEALSNLIMLKAFTAPLKAANSAEKIAEYARRGVISQVSEQGTETITALGQNREELRAGLTKEELSVADAFRQQFVQTLITTGVMAGGAKGVQQVNKFYETYVEPKVRPGSALARAIQADLTTFLEQQPATTAPYKFVPLAPITAPAEPEPLRPELKELQAARKPEIETEAPEGPTLSAMERARKPELETEAPPDRTLSALERARNEGIEVEAPEGPTLSAMERARKPEIEGAPITPPVEEMVLARAVEYERQGYMEDDARLLAERDVAAEMRQDVGGRAVQRQDIEDERRTAEGRAERAAMSMEAPSELPEPPSYVTEPSADEYGAAVPSRTDRTTRGPVSAFDRGLDIARGVTGELDARERAERASLDANQRRIESDVSQAFARDAFPDLGVTLGASWVRSTLAKNPTPEEYQDAAYARMEELDGQRPADPTPAFERTAAPAPAETKAEAKPTAAKPAETKAEAPAGAKMRRPTDREKSNFSASAVIDFGPAGQAVIAEGLQDVYIQDKKGNELSVRQWDSRPGSIKTAEEFPDFVPESLRQPIIDYQDAAYKNKLGTPETQATLNRARTKLQQAVTELVKPAAAPEKAKPAAPATAKPAVAPEIQTAKDLLSAIDEGGIPLNPSKLNNVARDIGLDVSKSAKPEETIKRIRDAVQRTETKPAAAPATAKPAVTPEKKGYKPLAPAQFAPLELEAGRREDLEVEPSEIAEVKKAEQALTKAGTPRQRAPGAGRPKSETAKTPAERVAQSNALNKFNRDVALLIEKAKEFSERQAMETFETPDEFEYKEALRDMHADQMRAVIYGIAQRTGSMAQGVIDAKGYIRSLPEALRNRAKALHEGTAKLSDYHEIPPKPEVLIERERKSAEYKKARAEGKAKKEAIGKPLAAVRRAFTDAFKTWFGDSKIVNEDGTPMVVYHGTTRDIKELKAGKEGGALGNGIYLTPDSVFAGEYAKETGGNVMPVYASIKNPLVIDGSISRDPMTEALVKLGVDRTKAESIVEKAYDEKGYITNEVKSRATKQGYDGIVQYKNGVLHEIVAFNAGQVRSMFQNALAARMRDAFKAWFGNSVVRNKDGSPKVMYHGTARDIHVFRAKQAGAIFVTENPNFAHSFSQMSEGYMVREYVRDNLSLEEHRALEKRAEEIAKENGTSADDEFYALVEGLLPSRANIMPVYVSAQNPFDYEKRIHLEALAEVIDSDKIMEEVTRGSWSEIESKDVQSAIKALGFDGFYVKEGRYKNLAVYDPTQIKSIFNPGTYSTTDPNILAARPKEQEVAELTDDEIYRIEQQLDMRPDPTFKELTSLTGALIYISESPNQLEAELAARLLQDDNIDYVAETTFQVVETDTTDVDPAAKEMLDDDAVGAYIPYTQGGSVFVRGQSYGVDQGINSEIVLHEAMHAIGAKKIAFVELAEKNDAPVQARLAEAVHQLRDLMDRARDSYAKLLAAGTAPSGLARLAEAEAFTNIQEFYAYGMTDPDMKLFLRDTVPGVSTKTSGFDRFVDILMRLFGVDPKLKSGLKDLLLVSNEIMKAKKPSDKALAELTKKENADIALKAKKQQSDEARVMRNLKAAKTAEEVVEQLGSLSTVAKNPALWGKWLKRNYTNMSVPALKGYLYSMPTNVVIDVGTEAGIGGLKEIDREVRNMTTFQHGRMREVENITKEWSKIKAPMQKKMAAVMNTATDLQVDPDKDTSNKELNKMWAELTPDAKAVYRKTRDFFKTSYNLYGAYLEQRIKNSGLKDEDKANIMASIRAMHEAGAQLEPYFPLMRHGEFWARFGKGDNVEFQMFDTPGDRDAFVEAKAGGKAAFEVMAAAGTAEKGNNVAALRERVAQQGGEISKIFDAIDKLGSGTVTQKSQLKDEIFQLHLLTLPEGSFRKQFIRRKGKAGYSGDALRNFALAGSRMATQLGKVKYGPILNNRIDAARASLAMNPNKDRLDMFVDEMNERVKEQITPRYEEGWWPSFVRAANRFAFVYALTTAKSAITNLFSLPINTVPTMMKYFGAKDTMAIVGKFMATLPAQVGITRVDAAGNVTYTAPSFGSSYMVRRDPELRRAAKAMEDMGITLSTQTYDLWLAKRGRASTSKTRQFTEGAVRVTGALFQGSERVIREVAFLSAFKLARKTMSFDDAIMKAVDVVNESLYDYSAWNTPRIARSNTAKLLTQFKKYALFTTIYYARNVAQMISPLKGETRRGAAYAFFGSMGLTGLASGVTGMWFVGFGMQAWGVLHSLWNFVFGGDDDDEVRKKMHELDFVRWFNNVYLPEEFGSIKVAGMDLSELLASGVINTATGYDFASSVSAGNLWFRDIPDSGQWENALANFVEYMSGPAINITGTMAKGVKDIVEGDTKKGLEKLLPIGALRGPMASWRMSEEGLVDKDLNIIKNADDFTTGMLVMQGLGYKTTGVAEVTNMNYYITKARREIEDKRGTLVRQWVKAVRKNDIDRVQDIQSNMSKFNRMFPIEGLIIDGEVLTDALDQKLEKAAVTNRGIEMKEEFREMDKLRERGLDMIMNE